MYVLRFELIIGTNSTYIVHGDISFVEEYVIAPLVVSVRKFKLVFKAEQVPIIPVVTPFVVVEPLSHRQIEHYYRH